MMDIQIRRAETDDYEAIHNIYSQPNVVWGTLQLPFTSVEAHRQRMLRDEDGSFPLLACVRNEVVGHLNLRTFPASPRRKHVGSISMAVHDDWQGKGVGTALVEAAVDLSDRWLNLVRLELQVFTDNEPAIHLYQKFGFEIEGTLRDYAFRDGQLSDVYMMARRRMSDNMGR